MSVDWLYKQFLNSRLMPQDQKKELLAGGFSEAAIDESLDKFYQQTGQIRKLTPPYMLAEPKRREDDWYPGAELMPGSIFWPSLKKHLLDEKGWLEPSIKSIHDASDRIVAWLDSPWAARINTRGLVVGYVQSGKTANFTAVIAKAADAGYRFFIVLSGTKKSLRYQTQQRLERELVNLNDDMWFTPTSTHDFRPMGNVNFFLSDKKHDKVLCVVKKNSAILRKLHSWLSGASTELLRACPFLIIDDEADEASINTARYQSDAEGALRERSTINRRIVDLLSLLPKAAYVGYTATPFANVFIDPSYEPGLYPKDFIVALPKPEGHFGTERIFGRERLLDDENDQEFVGLDMVRIIPQDEVAELKPTHNDHDFVPTVTKSLEEALAYFWMACAARIVRGQGDQHMTMLVHTAQLVRVHESTRSQIEGHRNWLLNLLQSKKGFEYVNWLQNKWEIEQAAVAAIDFGLEPVTFDQIKYYILPAIQHTFIVTDNYQSENRLSYDGDAQIQIAIGGNTLSRGLTLEGLLVSFFVRAAGAYDTLLQMGRWFGYRPGYSDLPRIWMTSQLESHFRDLATIEAEIRQDIAVYDREGETPQEFGVRIRTHPDLNITAPLKMQFAVEAQVSFDDSVQQTVLFEQHNYEWLNHNINATDELIHTLETANGSFVAHGGHWAAFGVSSDHIIEFLRNYHFHDNNRALQSENIVGYLQDQMQHDLLTRWNVIIRGVREQNRSERRHIRLGSRKYPLLDRARRSYPEDYAHIGVLMSRGDIGADLLNTNPSAIQNKNFAELKKMRVEEYDDRGLLLIYPINKDSKPSQESSEKVALDAAEDLIGLGFVLPPAKEDSRGAQSYVTVDLSRIDAGEFDVDEEEDEDA